MPTPSPRQGCLTQGLNMPVEGMTCLPPLVFREDDDGDRRSDACAQCGNVTWPQRGYGTGSSGGRCQCSAYRWTLTDQHTHQRYIDTVEEYESNYDDEESSPSEVIERDAARYVCPCPSCSTARAQVGSLTPEGRRHLQYRDSVRSSIRDSLHARGHRGNPCGALDWNGSNRGLSRRPRMGYEFECDARSEDNVCEIMSRLDAAWDRTGMRHAKGYLIQKTDGSVTGNYPVEFATVPCTVEEHRRVLDSAFPAGRFGAGRVRAWSNGSAGMHVHISRQFVSPLDCGKLGVFFHHPVNDKFLSDLSGRMPNTFCKRLPSAVREADTGRGDRYVAFNREPKRTVEVRAFRPSPKITSISKNLELVEAVIEWVQGVPICETTADDASRSDWKVFMQWISQPHGRKKYYHLHNWWLARAGEFGDYYRALCPRNVREVGRNRRRGFDEFHNNSSED